MFRRARQHPEPAPPRRPAIHTGLPVAFNPPARYLSLRSASPIQPLPPAVLPELVEEFHNRPPMTASYGESFAAGVPAPMAPPVRPVIPEPDWGDTAASLPLLPPAASDPVDPLAALKAGEGYDPPPAFGVDTTFTPLVPFRPPRPDWRAEQLEAARRNARDGELDEHPKSLGPRPA